MNKEVDVKKEKLDDFVKANTPKYVCNKESGYFPKDEIFEKVYKMKRVNDSTYSKVYFNHKTVSANGTTYVLHKGKEVCGDFLKNCHQRFIDTYLINKSEPVKVSKKDQKLADKLQAEIEAKNELLKELEATKKLLKEKEESKKPTETVEIESKEEKK